MTSTAVSASASATTTKPSGDDDGTSNSPQALNDPTPLIMGLSMPQSQPDAHYLLHQCREDGYDYCTTMLPLSQEPRSDVTVLEGNWWSTSVVGVLANNNNHNKSDASMKDANGSSSSPTTYDTTWWKAPLEWAWHMSLPTIIMPPLPLSTNTADLAEYARAVLTAAHKAKSISNAQLWIPLSLHAACYQQWITFYKLVQFHPNVGILLEFDAAPPPTAGPQATATHLQQQLQLLHLLIGQGLIRAVSFHCSGHFLTNKVGYPTLSKYHQALLVFLLRRIGHRLRLLVQGPAAHSFGGSSGSPQAQTVRGQTHCKPYLQYLQHMRMKRPEVRRLLDTTQAQMEQDFYDTLQSPLQPLKDHLPNATYEIFEKDPVKYAEYQRAVQMALEDLAATQHANNSNNKKRPDKNSPCVVCVLGAGRGPLVQAVLNAYETLGQNTKQQQQRRRRPSQLLVWAVEKNPSAVIYLNSLARSRNWGSGGIMQASVQVLQADVRYVTREMLQNRQADIVVSELLGSFGDNELSPECLNAFYGTTACSNSTISIPCRYTAYVTPVSSVRLHQKALLQGLYPNDAECGMTTNQVALETPYVVRPYDASQLHAAQPCWSFCHPQHGKNGNDLNRFVEVNFGPPDGVSSAAYASGFGPLDDQIIAASQAAAAMTAATANSDTQPPQQPQLLPWTMSGLLGTFTADLYYRPTTKEMVQISTVPTSFSVGMFSWFPLYFPLLESPVFVPVGASVRVHLWRRVNGNGSTSSGSGMNDGSRIWYEWAVTVYRTDPSSGQEEVLSVTPIHNPEGRSYHVSM